MDIEKIIESKVEFDSIVSLACKIGEFEKLRILTFLNDFKLVTLIFSAKEAIYKYLCPMVKIF